MNQLEEERFMCLPGSSSMSRPSVDGKFLLHNRERFFLKGTTYGAFAYNSNGDQFPDPSDAVHDLRLMRAAGINSVLTYTVPPISLLDQAQEHGLRFIINTPWMGHVCFLDEARTRRKVIREVREAVRSCRRHPAAMMFAVAKELPPAIVRWYGQRRVERFLEDLYNAAKDEDPDSLVTYTNFPTTEYLELPFVDVFTFNVYLHERSQLCSYLSRLQHLASERPLVLTELGMCSLRHGRQGQAEFLNWQLEEMFDHGVAGAVVFGWTDPFFQDNVLVEDWGFGLVDAQRRPKPSYSAVKKYFTRPGVFPPHREWPRVSVVVAAHNAGRTLDACLTALQNLRYADYEVIVVNDGSKDDTEAIALRYPFRTISTSNQGVSAARNVGLREATGEIVAYIDSDADADPDWLSYIATTYLNFDLSGVGGPNLVPREDNWIAKCVFRAPGGPTQVMYDDTYAEHIPGCNMTFRRSALLEVGGFDPIFRAAADDVDICWRLLEKGHKIGFAASAVVWHHRRPSAKAYWRQQVGYGVSEAILERKFPSKFNPFGHCAWEGRIYAPYPAFRLFTQPVVYHGLWGSAGFQPMYDPGPHTVWSFLPRAMEWHLGLAALLLLGMFFPWALAVFGAGVLYTLGYCVVCAANANLDILLADDPKASWLTKLRWRAMIGWLTFLEPVARDWGRLKGGLTPWRNVIPNSRSSLGTCPLWDRTHPFGREVRWSMAGNPAMDMYPILARLTSQMNKRGCAVGWNPVTANWDLWIRRGALGEAQVRVVVEHHGGARRLARLAARIRAGKLVRQLLELTLAVAAIAFAAGFPLVAGFITVCLALLWVGSIVAGNRLELVIQDAFHEVVNELQAADLAELEEEHTQEATA